MNKRIRKKKAKQRLIRILPELIEAAEEMERERQAAIRRAADVYIKFIEQKRAQRDG